MEHILRPFIVSFALGLVSLPEPDERRRAPEPPFWTEVDEHGPGITGHAVETVQTHQGSSLVASARVPIDSAGGSIQVGPLELGAGGSCEPSWLPTFGEHPGTDNVVWALTVYDDGAGGGPVLYVGGRFTTAGGVIAARVARWDGTSWSPLGDGIGSLDSGSLATVHALAVYDDGAGGGPALYAGGSFVSAGGAGPDFIAKWDGTSWSPLGGEPNSSVHALAVHDDGTGGGPALYAAGSFTNAGGVAADRIARWDGTSWSPLGSGMSSRIWALAVHDDGAGGGPALYAGGEFTNAGGVGAARIAKWDGTSWTALGSGANERVLALTVYDDGAGGGPALYVGGEFTSAGGASANRVARWDGTSWSALGGGIGGGFQTWVDDLTVHDDGTGGGPALYAGGRFTSAGGMPADSVARWDGTSWSALGSGTSDVFALAGYDDGDGSALYAGGVFFSAGGASVAGIAKWDGAVWSTLGSGLNADAYAMTMYDDGAGDGPALYVGGIFTSAGGASANRIARWDGTSWSALGSGLDSTANALTVYDDGAGGGPALYVAGWFTSAGGASANRVASWDGASWSALGGGLNSTGYALAVHDDGAGGGPALYAGGGGVAKWDGTSWSAVGAGMNNTVLALAVYDDGAGGGPALYAGGHFTMAEGTTANHVARWDGTSWSPLGAGMNTTVYALTVYDDGTGGGSALYAGGAFTSAGGLSASRIARWDGASWSGLGGMVSSPVRAITVYDDGAGDGPSLCAGGEFTVSPAADSYLARWGGCSDSRFATPFCFGDGSGTPCACGNAGGAGEGCANSTGAGARLSASGSASIGAGDFVLSGAQLVPAQPGLYFQGDMRVNSGNGVTFGDGLRCAGTGVVRLEVRVADGGGTSSTTVDIAESGGVSPGATKTYQLWYRDPLPSPCSSGFNLTNGLELSWTP